MPSLSLSFCAQSKYAALFLSPSCALYSPFAMVLRISRRQSLCLSRHDRRNGDETPPSNSSIKRWRSMHYFKFFTFQVTSYFNATYLKMRNIANICNFYSKTEKTYVTMLHSLCPMKKLCYITDFIIIHDLLYLLYNTRFIYIYLSIKEGTM